MATVNRPKLILEKDRFSREYVAEYLKTLSLFSGRGFKHAPGIMMKLFVDIQDNYARGLEEATYKVLLEDLQNLLKAGELTQQEELLALRITFEIDKTTALAGLEKELGQLKNATYIELEEIERIEADYDIRSAALALLKAGIDKEVEIYKRQEFDAEKLSFDKERELVETRLATARRKLDVLPYMEQTLAAATKVVEEKKKLIPLYEEKAASEVALAEKMTELIPLLEERSTLMLQLADAILLTIPIRKEIASIQKQIVELTLLETETEEQKLAIQLQTQELLKQLNELKNNLKELEAEFAEAYYRASAKGQEVSGKLEVDVVEKESRALLDKATSAINALLERAEAKNLTELKLVQMSTGSDVEVIEEISATNVRERTKTAEISATATITSALIHSMK